MIVIGLGNPDKKYAKTYHNVGFMLADKLCDMLNLEFKTKECKAVTAIGYCGGERLVVAKPQTYMNLSGESVRELIGRYKAQDDDIIIVYDDVDLAVGELRLRRNGSAGTHNGMRNITALTRSESMPRLRIGIGRPTAPMQLADYVLSEIRGENLAIIDTAIDKASSALIDYIKTRDFERFLREIAAINASKN